jgi:recombinational DNA repair ATPase RecF
MVVERSGTAVYDEHFHPRVNIIRGENSSGKSTVLNFIHYGLGGDVSEWSEMALLCERVTVEVLLAESWQRSPG